MSKKYTNNVKNNNYPCKNIYYPSNDWTSLCEKCRSNRWIHTHEYIWERLVKIK